MVVVPAPPLQHDLGFAQRVEDLAVQQLVPQLAVEALVVAVLPGTARLDEERLHAHLRQPLPHRLGREFRPVVRADVLRHSAADEELRQRLQDLHRGHAALDAQRQALPGVLVDHRQDLQRPAVVGPLEDEVVGPDVVSALRPEPHARAVIPPQAASFGLLPGHLESFLPPDPLDPLLVHAPARLAQEARDGLVAVAAEAGRQLDDLRHQDWLVVPHPQPAVLGRAGLPEDAAGPPLGNG